MYVRDARNRDEVWLLDHIEAMGLDETAFRSRDYVIAVQEGSNTRAGFGRYRVHATRDGDVCELTSIGVLEGWRDQGVGAHIVERLIETAGNQGFKVAYALTSAHAYLTQFGFELIEPDDLPPVLQRRLEGKREHLDPDAISLRIDIEAFEMPPRLRERFKAATEDEEESGAEPEEAPEDFGIDPEEATYKYDTGR